MAGKRTYGDRCGVARALDLVGERWALLVVRELLLGPKRFTDLRAGLPHLGPDVLTQRLKELEAAGIVTRTTLAPPAAAKVYSLTPRGLELEPVVLALGRFGSVAPVPAGEPGLGLDAFVVALKTLYRPSRAGSAPVRAELRLGGQVFALDAGEEVAVVRGPADGPHVVIGGDHRALAAAMWHGADLAAAEADGRVVIEGDRRAATRLLARFPLPVAA